MRRILSTLGAVALLGGAGAACAEGPEVAGKAVCRPSFAVTGGEFSAGTGFLLKSGQGEEVLLVTAQHLFGQGGGLEKDIAWDRMADEVSGVTCRSFAGGGDWKGVRPVEIRDAKTLGESGQPRDVAAFPIKASATPLILATTPPAVGERVWLATQLVGGAPGDVLLHPAVVAKLQAGIMYVLYDNPDLQIRATSGAPVVNARGEVVGINFGGRKTQAGDMVGIVQDLESVKAALAAIQR